MKPVGQEHTDSPRCSTLKRRVQQNGLKTFASESTVDGVASGLTSSCHRDFFQDVTIEREVKGKNHSLGKQSTVSNVTSHTGTRSVLLKLFPVTLTLMECRCNVDSELFFLLM